MTKVYGASDDLIEFEGGVTGEVNCYDTDKMERGVLVVLSDGTTLEVKYCKNLRGVWGVVVLKKGTLFDKIEICTDENADSYSDVAYFKDGIKWAYAARNWEVVS